MDEAAPKGTRERILEAAELLFAERGYAGTRLHEIAHEVGVQKASLFHHFASKEDLYRAVLAEGHEDSKHALEKALGGSGSPLQNIIALAEAYVDIVVMHPERTKILLRQSLGDAPPGPLPRNTQNTLDVVESFVAAWQRQSGKQPVDLRATMVGVIGMVAFFFASAAVLTPDWFARPLDPENVARVKRLVTKIVEDELSGMLDSGAATPARTAAAVS